MCPASSVQFPVGVGQPGGVLGVGSGFVVIGRGSLTMHVFARWPTGDPLARVFLNAASMPDPCGPANDSRVRRA